jgi:hypothetical protein
MQPREIAAFDQTLPAMEVALVRLARDSASESAQVQFYPRPPLLEAVRGEKGGESAVEVP